MFDLENCPVPAVFAQEPAKSVSERYCFIPTTRLIDDLRSLEWFPVGVKGSTRAQDIAARHMIRFRSKTDLETPLREVCPELVIVNAHNGLCSFNLKAGIFRMVCANGLIVSESIFASIKIRHINYSYDAVRDAVLLYAERIPQVSQKVQELQQITLSDSLKITFARMAVAARFEGIPGALGVVDLERLLAPTRAEDKGSDVWSVLNVLQSKLLNGKFQIPGKKKPREIRSVQRIITLNQRLFDIAEAVGMIA
ncbi:MAG: DUF932 domain-containing protein [Turneriella sp.]|nr:DUF932 domain-containing protein [Turneriella sp.]